MSESRYSYQEQHQEPEPEQRRPKSKRRKMNCIGPTLVILSVCLNMWMVMFFFVLTETDFGFVFYKHPWSESFPLHVSLAVIYFVLVFMTVWSYLTAKCTEPGFVPRKATSYDKEKLPDKERMLWEYLQKNGAFRENLDEIQESPPSQLRKSEPCTSTPDLSSNRMKGQPRSDDKDAHAVHVLLTDSKDLAPMPYTSKSGGVSVAQTDKSRSVAIMEQVSQEAD